MTTKEEAHERRRTVVALREQGLSNIEIARRLGITVSAVATLIYRAKQSGMDVPPPHRRRSS